MRKFALALAVREGGAISIRVWTAGSARVGRAVRWAGLLRWGSRAVRDHLHRNRPPTAAVAAAVKDREARRASNYPSTLLNLSVGLPPPPCPPL